MKRPHILHTCPKKFPAWIMDSTITIHNSPLELQFSSIQQYPSTAAGLQEGEEVFPGPPSRSSQ